MKKYINTLEDLLLLEDIHISKFIYRKNITDTQMVEMSSIKTMDAVRHLMDTLKNKEHLDILIKYYGERLKIYEDKQVLLIIIRRNPLLIINTLEDLKMLEETQIRNLHPCR
jgi:hypothetical protein